MLGAQSGVGAQQRAQTLDHEARRDEQHGGERHLGDDQQAARTGAAATRASCPRAGGFHRFTHIDAGRANRRRDAEQQTRQHRRTEREGKHAQIELRWCDGGEGGR